MKNVFLVAVLFIGFVTAKEVEKVAIPDGGLPIHYAQAVRATPESLKGYGKIVYPKDFDSHKVEIVTWPKPGWRSVVEGTGNEGGTTQGDFCMRWEGNKLYAKNHAVGRKYLIGTSVHPDDAESLAVIAEGDRTWVVTYEANYHPDGGQLVVPKENKPFVALLALPGDDITLDSFRAFYFDGSFGVEIAPGVWHQPLFSVKDSLDFSDRQGKVHACIATNFPEEFGHYVALPLFDPEA